MQLAMMVAPDRQRGPGWFVAALPPGAAGQWCNVAVTLRTHEQWWAKVLAIDLARGQVVRDVFLGRLRGGRRAILLHVPTHADHLILHVITIAASPMPVVALSVLGRGAAALRLLAAGWRQLFSTLSGSPAGIVGRVRTAVGQAPARAGEAPPYSMWVHLHDGWGPAERDAFAARAHALPGIEILVIGEPTQACLDGLASQWLQPERVSIARAEVSLQRLVGTWLILLQGDEQLAPHALACFAHAIGRMPEARGITADVDILQAGQRNTPLFKPRADAWLRNSGLLTQGACVFHPSVILPPLEQDANAMRTKMAQQFPTELLARVPFILTHAAGSARPVMARKGACPAATPAFDGAAPSVTIVIASSGRRRHSLRCLRRLLACTDYTCFDILLAVSSVNPADRCQRAILRRAGSMPQVRVLDLQMPTFNYAAVSNAAARQARGDLLLLLNDDVVPIRADWLRRMVDCTLAPPEAPADIVGARLLYGNGRVQHGGVIMGLAGLCEHAFRLTTHKDGGPHGIALLQREISAVTAACLLVRRTLWEQVCGMDEGFAVALNDVDFCLRAGEVGARIVFAAPVELTHYESLSLGRHYQGARAGLETQEVRCLFNRWQSVIAMDPHYHPLASIEPGREFQPAFPPRLTPLCWIEGESPASSY